MSHIMTEDETRQVAHLSRLTFNEEEIKKHTQCLVKILHLFDALDNIETGDIYHLDLKGDTVPHQLREDVITEEDCREHLANFCPNFNKNTGHIIVPQVIEES